MASLQFSVVAPDRTVVDEPVESLIAPGVAGYLGVMPNHEPMILALQAGLVEYCDPAKQRRYVAIGGGFMEITGDKVTVLADSAEHASEIDIREAEEALEAARAALRGEESRMGSEEATRELERQMARIRAAKRSN